jgi:hypothetical protein
VWSAGVEVGEDGQDPAVVLGGLGQAELGQQDPDVVMAASSSSSTGTMV